MNTLKFNGRLGARKLRAGRYRLLMYVQDPVGNITDQPPIQLFTVRRVTQVAAGQPLARARNAPRPPAKADSWPLRPIRRRRRSST